MLARLLTLITFYGDCSFAYRFYQDILLLLLFVQLHYTKILYELTFLLSVALGSTIHPSNKKLDTYRVFALF